MTTCCNAVLSTEARLLCEPEWIDVDSLCVWLRWYFGFSKKFVRLIFGFGFRNYSRMSALWCRLPASERHHWQLSVKQNFTWSHLMAISNVKSGAHMFFLFFSTRLRWMLIKTMIMNSIDTNALKIRNKFNSKFVNVKWPKFYRNGICIRRHRCRITKNLICVRQFDTAFVPARWLWRA